MSELRAVRVYISGPISGLDMSQVRSAFGIATQRLVSMGYAVVNPLEVRTVRCQAASCGEFDGHSWLCWMRHDIAELVTCDEVAVLPGSHNSRGARIETDLATRLGLPVRPIAEYLDGAA